MRNNLDGAVLLLNLGSPKELTKRSVREYLRIFLSDDYVVDLPKVLQQLILYLFIFFKYIIYSFIEYIINKNLFFIFYFQTKIINFFF